MWQAGRTAILGLALGVLLAGCFPFFPFGIAEPLPIGGPAACDGMPIASATPLQHVSGSIKISGGETKSVTLSKVLDASISGADPSCPGFAQAEWTDSSGQWTVALVAFAMAVGVQPSEPGELMVLRSDREPPLSVDGLSCVLTLTEVSSNRLAGQADCHGLRWTNDYVAQANPEFASPDPNLPPFDLTITFDARP